MTLLIDPPNAAGHGLLWSHLASDTSFEELHAFARRLGVPERGFDRDHYDVPAEWYELVVEAGAVPVGSRELIDRLVAAGLRRRKTQALGPRQPGQRLVRPRRLRAGDLVAVVAPAGPVAHDRLRAGVARLREWGLDVREPRPLPDAEVRWLAGTDRARADALTEAWLDPDVAALWCTRGGFGSQRIIDLLDWDLLATVRPPLLVGFSDITALHQAVAARLGLTTVHGPGVAGLADVDAASRDAVRRLVFDAVAPDLTGRPGAPGRARGVLVGGNVTMLASGAGTGSVQPASGSIALLEDVGEAPYRLDRALTHLLRSGWLMGVRAVVCGEFPGCGDPAEVRSVLETRLGPLDIPIVYDLPVGHGETNVGLPLGVPGQVDGDAGTLTFGVPALR